MHVLNIGWFGNSLICKLHVCCVISLVNFLIAGNTTCSIWRSFWWGEGGHDLDGCFIVTATAIREIHLSGL